MLQIVSIVNKSMIEEEIRKNKCCSRLFAYIVDGWPNKDKIHGFMTSC